MRTLILLPLLAACAGVDDTTANQALEGQLAPPAITLTVPAEAIPGSTITFTVTGAGFGEPVYVGASTGAGAGPCYPAMGGTCLDITAPVRLVGVAFADAAGVATLTATVPPGAALGTTFHIQSTVVRGFGGSATLTSNVGTVFTVADIEGCTNPLSPLYNPAATIDDGSCNIVDPTVPGYAGPAGPDLSGGGWTLCSGTSSGATTYNDFYPPCAGFPEVRFACSVDANDTAEFISDRVPVPGSAFTDTTCDDWAQGANSVYGSGRILSIDPSNPGCGNYNVSFDLYMDMVSPQWGCAGTNNTHTTGGRMWMYGLAGTPPTVPVTVPGFAGEPGPDLTGLGFSQCAGTADAATTSAQFYALCGGYDEIIYACSVDANASAEFTSAAFPITGLSLTDGVCDDWTGGANSPYATGHIVSIDASDPGCGNYNVGYDLYLDMVSPQWGCAGTTNTHATGGRMWAWVR